jgi:hypothetical protein
VAFWFTAVGGNCFWRRRDFRTASLGWGWEWEWQKTAHMELELVLVLVLCASGASSNDLLYFGGDSGYSACNAISASKHLLNNTPWHLACVTDLVDGRSSEAIKTSPKKCVLVPGTGLSQSRFSMHHAHTNFLSFTCSTYKARQACKSEAKLMHREHPNCAIFPIFFSLHAVVGEAAISLRRRPARRHLVSTARTQTR